MTVAELLQSMARRARRPATWAVVLGFQLLWVPVRLLAGVSFHRMGAWEFFLPALFLAGHLLLAPLPWQWGGSQAQAPALWRGALQSIPWNAAWVFLLLLGVQDIVQPAKPRPEPLEASSPAPEPPGGPRPRPQEERREGGPPRPRPQELRRTPPPGPRQEWVQMFINLPFSLVLGYFLAEKERVERAESELREREREARAQTLQAQLHPHVLFNVLGGITELVHEDPDAAEAALIGLVDMLRMLLRHGGATALPLGQERALIERYLEIESIRLGERLQLQWTWPAALDAIAVPPLLIQPLVENAIKHGIAPAPQGGTLHIEGLQTAAGLMFRVRNTGLPLPQKLDEGTGLGNLRARLALLPPPRPQLTLRQDGEWVLAELCLGGTLGA